MKHNMEIECKNCKEVISYSQDDCFWDDKGFGYSTKLIKCPKCGALIIVGYQEDRAMKLNNDDRYYDYRRKTFIK